MSARMKGKDGKKTFDCVAWTRETRNRISAQIKDLSTEEKIRWFENRRPSDPFLAKLFDRSQAMKANRRSVDSSGERDEESR